ncbi:MAG: nucleotidyltransferase domain-containing protein [Rhodocyclaceae bacterium]|nr:nucleotidyltransferase domain-containing protein [Rhodocyclaceae bacterium]
MVASELIDSALTCLKTAVPLGTRLVLFGSRARGDARDNSDLDILVIEPQVADSVTEMIRLSRLTGQHLIPADIVVMNDATFQKQRQITNTLAWRAAREGIFHDCIH